MRKAAQITPDSCIIVWKYVAAKRRGGTIENRVLEMVSRRFTGARDARVDSGGLLRRPEFGR